ncbi:MAG: exonuclease subunit SbcD [Bacteroidota bacterium]
MKLLHTADWHLGKRLDHVSRLAEQKNVLAEICEIADQEEVDAVLIAGDLFDTVNPSIEAIELFYQTLKKLANNGQRAVIGIAGNHDSPDRIEAPDPLARECGIILTGYPNSQVPTFRLESGLEVIRSDKGFLELKLPGSEHPLRLILTPYANEIRLKKALGSEAEEEALRSVLESSWKASTETYCDDQGCNVLMTHLFVIAREGAEKPEEIEGEKPILTVGGASEIYAQNFPENIQYVALGHLHRAHQVTHPSFPVWYSGSPLGYSMSEAGQQKYVNILELEPGKTTEVKQLPLKAGRTLVRLKADSVEEARKLLKDNPNSWVELSLALTDFLTAAERKILLEENDGLISIIPQIQDSSDEQAEGYSVDLSKDMESLFMDYFQHKHQQAPNENILSLFKEVISQEEEA